MRDLTKINQVIKGTGHFFRISLIIPILLGLGAYVIATDAAPNADLENNFLAILGLSITLISIMFIPFSHIFKWDWQAKYFGASIFSLGSGAIIGLFPVLCVAQYSSLSPLIRSSILIIELALIMKWCSRFVIIYNRIYSDKRLKDYLYIEDHCAVYYSQEADRKILENLLKFESCPSAKYFTAFGFAGFLTIPFANDLSRLLSIPFIHIFLSIFTTPLNLLFLGLATKGWLVYYYYPKKIRAQTNKKVYVDMSSPANLI